MPLPRYRRTDGIVSSLVGSERLLLDPRDQTLHVLNPTASAVWEALARWASAVEVTGVVRAAFDVAPGSDVAGDVERLLAELVRRGLAVAETDAP